MASRKQLTEEELNERKFLENCKLYFSSLSGRATQYAYLNLGNGTMLLTNSTSSGSDTVHGDRVMDYCVGELCFHLVYPKDQSWFTELRTFLDLPDTECVCIKLNSLMNWLGKYKRKDVEVGWSNDALVLRPKGRESWDGRNVIGFIVRNFHVIKQLKWWHISIENIGTEEHRNMFPYHIEKCKLDVSITGRIFFVPVETKWYTDKNNQYIFNPEQGYQPVVEMLGLDGMSCVSLREFIKKFKDNTYSLIWYSWVVNKAIFSMTHFENELADIKSIRPYTPLIPLRIGTTPSNEFYKSQSSNIVIN